MIPGTYERTANKLTQGQPKPKPFCMVINGRLVTGTKSLHRTPQGRAWQLFWRMKDPRNFWKKRAATL